MSASKPSRRKARMRYDLDHAQLLALKRFTTPTIANALELCSERSPLTGFNRDETRDFMPDMGPMVGYAVTAEYCASRPRPGKADDPFIAMLRLLEASPKPAIVVIRDVDAPAGIVGSPWGECAANICRALGAVGTVTDGAIRDLSEMINVGFHALARRLCVSHALGHYLSAGKPVEVFGTVVRTGELIHADRHGFITVPTDGVARVPAAAAHIDRCEQRHIIAPARQAGFDVEQFIRHSRRFGKAVAAFGLEKDRTGEWG